MISDMPAALERAASLPSIINENALFEESKAVLQSILIMLKSFEKWHHDFWKASPTPTTYIMIMRFRAVVAGQWSAAEVCNRVREMFQGHLQGCELEVSVIGFGNASLEMVPRREDVPSSNLRVFGPEVSCFYKE